MVQRLVHCCGKDVYRVDPVPISEQRAPIIQIECFVSRDALWREREALLGRSSEQLTIHMFLIIGLAHMYTWAANFYSGYTDLVCPAI